MNIDLFRYVNTGLRSAALDAWAPLFSERELAILPLLLVCGFVFYLGARRTRLILLAMGAGIALADLGSEQVIKEIVRQPRPYATLDRVHLHTNGAWIEYDPSWIQYDRRRQSYAFPSSHAANAAAVATAFALVHPATLLAGAPLALLVGFSRIYTGNHYPLDVAAGWLWGVLCMLGAWGALRWAMRRWGGGIGPERWRTLSRDHALFAALLAAWALSNFLFVHLGIYDLAGDEAQYWEWSRRLDLGYYSKPPMIAYWIKLFTEFGGHHAWSIRTGAIVLSLGTAACLFGLARRIAGNDRTGLLAAVAAFAMPSSWAGGILMTIDALLAFYWSLAMYAFYRALRGDRGMWLLAGLALGGGLLSKYTMLFLFLSFALYLVLFDRAWLRRPGPWLAFALALAMNLGVLYWNWSHDWVSLRHTAAIGENDRWAPLRAIGWFGEFWGGQTAIVSPLLFGFFAWAVHACFKRRADRDAAFLACCAGVLFGFYLLVSFVREPNINWPVCAYLPAAVAFAWQWQRSPRPAWARRTLAAAIAIGCAIGLLPRITGIAYGIGLPIDPDLDPTTRLIGGRELGEALGRIAGPEAHAPFIFSDRYQNAALAAFYTPGRPRTWCVNLGRRRNQYDLWGGWEQLAGRDGIYIAGGDVQKAQFFVDGMVYAGLFERGELIGTVEVARAGVPIATYRLARMYRCSGKPLEPPGAGY